MISETLGHLTLGIGLLALVVGTVLAAFFFPDPDKMKTLNEKKRSNINDFALLRRRVDERTRDYTSRRTEEEE